MHARAPSEQGGRWQHNIYMNTALVPVVAPHPETALLRNQTQKNTPPNTMIPLEGASMLAATKSSEGLGIPAHNMLSAAMLLSCHPACSL